MATKTSILGSLLLAQQFASAGAQSSFILGVAGPSCNDLLAGDPATDVGEVCAEIIVDNLEVDVAVDADKGCWLVETHLCNVPSKEFNANEGDEGGLTSIYEYSLPVKSTYEFVCATEEDTYTVAGHATVHCPSETTRGGVDVLMAYYEIELLCNPGPDQNNRVECLPGSTFNAVTSQCDPCVTEGVDAPAPADLPYGMYKLLNHQDGGARNPLYGFRLDGLFTDNQNDIVTLNFEDDIADMKMSLHKDTITISGVVYGGTDIGQTYAEDENTGAYDVTFRYTNVSVQPDGYVALKSEGASGSNTGTIKSRNTNKEWNLVDEAGGHTYSFRVKKGHRKNADYSGWGWVNHAVAPATPSVHLYASDWLFAVGDSIEEYPKCG